MAAGSVDRNSCPIFAPFANRS